MLQVFSLFTIERYKVMFSDRDILVAVTIVWGLSLVLQGLWCVWGKNRSKKSMGLGYPVFVAAHICGALIWALQLGATLAGILDLDLTTIIFYIVEPIVIVIFFYRIITRGRLDPFLSLLLTLTGLGLILVGISVFCAGIILVENTNVTIYLG